MKTLFIFLTLFLFQEKPKETKKPVYNTQTCLGCPDGFIRVYQIYHFDEIERSADGINVNYYVLIGKTLSKVKPKKFLVGIENTYTGTIFWHKNFMIK